MIQMDRIRLFHAFENEDEALHNRNRAAANKGRYWLGSSHSLESFLRFF